MTTSALQKSQNLSNTVGPSVTRAPVYLVLLATTLFTSVYPYIDVSNIEVSLLDIPALLILVWFRGKLLATLLAAAAMLALLLWGRHEFAAWIALFGNALLLILTIKWIRTEHKQLGLSVIGFGYWVLLGVPLTYLAFWLPAYDSDYALAATGQRLFSGVSCITIAIASHFIVVLAQHRLPDLIFGGPRRFTVRMREISETAALLAASTPLLVLLWIMTNSQIEASIQRLFSASDARFEALALSAAAAITEQQVRLDQLRYILPNFDEPGTIPSATSDQDVLDALAISGSPAFLILAREQEVTYASSNADDLGLGSETIQRILTNLEDQVSTPITDDPQGAIAFSPSENYPRLILVYPTALDLWHALYRSDMLGQMTGKTQQGVIDRVSHFHGPSSQELYGISSEARIVEQEYDYAIWVPPARVTYPEKKFSRLGDLKNSYITFQASDELIDSFDRDLYDVDCFRFTVDFWSHIGGSIISFAQWIFGGSLLLLAMAALIEFVVSRFSNPFNQLVDAMEQVAKNPNATDRSLFSFDTKNATSLFQRLVNTFSSMEQSIAEGFERTTALNTSYESLLDGAQIGFISFTLNNEVAYENIAARELLSSSPELLTNIKKSLGSVSEVLPINTSNASGQVNLLMSQAERMNIQGETDGYWIIMTDISPLKRAERDLLAAQRLSTLGKMTTGMAHEINQPLQTITLSLVNLQLLLKEHLSQTPKAKEKIERILEAVKKISTLIDFMKTYGGINSVSEDVFNPVEAIKKAIEEHSMVASKVLHVTYLDQSEKAIAVKGDATQFKLVMSHLIKNALDAAVENKKETLAELTIKMGVKNDVVIITAADNCGGVPVDCIDQIFDPFFTTKDPDKGTGLGLSVSHGIIAAMSGRIEVVNTEEGAMFSITVPGIVPIPSDV